MNKTCPKCNSKEIFTNEGLSSRGERSTAPLTGFTNYQIAVYVCLDCGFFEEYIKDSSLKSQKFKDVINKDWKKIND